LTRKLERHQHGVDCVFHLAAVASVRRSWQAFAENPAANVAVTQRLVSACEQAGVRRLVYASSSSVYGSAYRPSRESDRARPGWEFMHSTGWRLLEGPAQPQQAAGRLRMTAHGWSRSSGMTRPWSSAQAATLDRYTARGGDRLPVSARRRSDRPMAGLFRKLS
jgi:hypothetical protein